MSLPRKSASPRKANPVAESQPAHDDAHEHTLDGLRARFGVVDRARVVAFVGRAPPATLVLNGSRVSVRRVLGDGVRLFGTASDFFDRATRAQRTLLLAVTPGFLAAGVAALDECDSRGAAIRRAKDKRKKRQRGARQNVQDAVKVATSRREVLHAACVTLAGGDPEWKRRLDVAWGEGETTPESLVGSLRNLVSEARELAADATERGVEHALDAEYFDGTLAVAQRLDDVIPSDGGLVAPQNISQGDLDWWKGACLWFVQTLLSAFAAARKEDARIPALRVATLRGVFQRKSAKKKPENKPPTHPALTRRGRPRPAKTPA
jgi:hypothetical protein